MVEKISISLDDDVFEQVNKKLMLEIVNKIQDSIIEIIDKYKIDCIGFIPPTVARKTQLMTFVSKYLRHSCKELEIYNFIRTISQK